MKKTFFPYTMLQILGTFIAALLLALPYMIITMADFDKSHDIHATVFYILIYTQFIGICCYMNYRRHQSMALNFHLVNTRLLIIMFAVVLIFSLGIKTPVNHLIDQIIYHHQDISNPADRPVHIIGAILIAPVAEEIMFRGIILKGLLTRYSPRYAILFSALLFGLMHGYPLLIWPAISIGLILGWIYYHTKSIGTTILLHSFANCAVLIHQYVVFTYGDTSSVSSLNIFLLILSIPLFFIAGKQLISEINSLKIKNIKDETIGTNVTHSLEEALDDNIQ